MKECIMTDAWVVLLFVTLVISDVLLLKPMYREIKELKEVNSLLFGEGMATTARLNEIKRSKRCKQQ